MSKSSPRIFSYVVRDDFGFAPNPFHGVCSLACCKPVIRKHAKKGDFVVGTSSMRGASCSGQPARFVYAMRVTDVTCFDAYWNDARFQCKKPKLEASRREFFGDNIYRWDRKKKDLVQEEFCHCELECEDCDSLWRIDTRITAQVLLSEDFIYWGGVGRSIPEQFTKDGQGRQGRYQRHIVKTGPGMKSRFSQDFVDAFAGWFEREVAKRDGRLEDPGGWSIPKVRSKISHLPNTTR